LVVTAALLIAAGAAVDTEASAAPTDIPTTHLPTTVPTSSTTGSTVTLITGDQVTVLPEATGPPTYAVTKNVSGAYSAYRDPDGDEYVIPAVVRPYLGRELDRSLFDVSALVRVGAVDGARVPVVLSYAAGVTPVPPPGVSIDATSGNTATGGVTPASARDFTNGLRRLIGADVAAGRSLGTDAPAPGLTGMRLAGGTAPAVASPHLPLNVLRVDVTDLTGAPATNADLVLLDVDSFRRVTPQVAIDDGVARVQVPAGNYSAIVQFTDFDQDGNLTAFREVVKQDFVIQAGTDIPPLSFTETDSTIPVTVSTPRPAVEQEATMDVARTDSTGASLDTGIIVAAPTQLYTNATPATPTAGKSRFVVTWNGSATDPADAYAYSLEFASDGGVSANQHYTARTDQLATVRQRLSTDPATHGEGLLADAPTDPVADEPTLILRTPMPQALTHYYGTADGTEWSQSVSGPGGQSVFGPRATFAAGQQYTQDWGHGPITPGLSRFTNDFLDCGACSTGDDLDLELGTYDDSNPGHNVFPDVSATSDRMKVFRDGTPVFDADTDVARLTGIPLQPGTYRAVLDEDYTGVSGHSQALVTHTEMTVAYDPTATADPLPVNDFCAAGDTEVRGAACQILPALTLHYQLATDLTNSTSAPVQTLRLLVDHVTYNGIGARTPITSATIAVSYDGGHHWRQVPVAGRSGDYVAVWPNPSSGRAPELKVTARDAAGNSISQTVSDPYTIRSGK
jgi:hypothetical protein